MISVKFKGLDEAIKDLNTLAKRAVPYAMRDALNSAAFEARRAWGEEIKRTFTTRNTFTAGRALVVVKATGTDARRMVAVVGSTAPFMAKQEHGGTERGRTGARPIPGPVAAGQAPGGKRTRLVRAGRRLAAISAAKAGHSGNRKQRNAIALAMARRKGKQFAVLERPRGGRGLFLLGGGKRKLTTRLVWDLSKRSARVPPHPTLGPALKRLEPRLPQLMHDAVVKQLKRHRILGY